MTEADLDSLSQPSLRLTRDQILEILERETQVRLHMSAQRFIHRLSAGQIHDVGAVADLVVLVDLLRKDDPLFDAA
jgi:hypothetical protein